MKRREFTKTVAASVVGLSIQPSFAHAFSSSRQDFISKRPLAHKRNFVSAAVEDTIRQIRSSIPDKEIAWMFENCFPNTLDTTVKHSIKNGKPDTFVITGDIEAMWMRDSSAQVWPYLPLIEKDQKLKTLVKGVINRQTASILIDPYANAFNEAAGESMWANDITEMKPELHERKWEIDSLCYPVRLAYGYWKISGDGSVFDDSWRKAAHLIIRTFIEQQRKAGPGPYKFMRVTTRWTDTLTMGGYGMPTKKIGLIHSMFRPSDDACIYPFLIPSNYFASTILGNMAEIARQELKDHSLADSALRLKNELDQALEIYGHGIINGRKVLAYEVDGLGNQYFADDANVPSLLSLPYLNALSASDPLYSNTRDFILSSANGFYFEGKAASGIGGPHVGMDMIWPMAIIMRALTSQSSVEIKTCLEQLKSTHAGTGFMHEAFHKDDPSNFTRPWFAWANTLFGELILNLYRKSPEIFKD